MIGLQLRKINGSTPQSFQTSLFLLRKGQSRQALETHARLSTQSGPLPPPPPYLEARHYYWKSPPATRVATCTISSRNRFLLFRRFPYAARKLPFSLLTIWQSQRIAP